VEFAFQDPFQLAASLVPVVRKQADVVVLMSEMSPSDTDRLIQTVPGIDVALYGQRPSYEETAKKTGTTIVNQTGTRGQYAGRLTLIIDPDGKITDFGSQNVGLDKAIPEDEAMTKAVTDATNKATQIRTDSRQQRQSEFETKLSGDRFLGMDTCKRCHQKQYDQWAASPHALAFASLDKPVTGKPRTPQCTGCHVTGMGDPSGYKADPKPDQAQGRPDLVNVQCESCHGKGTLHDRSGNHGQVAKATCLACHTQEWSPNFDYDKALLAVKH
jgi:hypothetical protein